MVSASAVFSFSMDFQDFLAGARFQPVEHLRYRPHAAVGFAAEVAQGLQLLADHGGDLMNDLGRNLIQVRHAQRHVRANLGGQRDQQRGRLRGTEVREDEGDGLRMLAVDELGQLLGIGFLQGVEGRRIVAHGLHQPVHQLARGVRSKALNSSLRA